MSKRGPKLYLQDILTSINNIEEYVKGMTFNAFVRDDKTMHAVVRNFEIIGEAAKNMPPELITKYPDVPWKEMVSMRNKVLHEYFGVDTEILWKTIQEDIPSLKEQVEGLPELLE